MTTEEILKQGFGIAGAIVALQALVRVVRRYVFKEDQHENRREQRITTLEAQLAERDKAIADLHESYGRKLEAKEREARADGRMVHRAAIALGDVPESIDGLALSMARSNAILSAEVAAMRSAMRVSGIRVDAVVAEMVPDPKALQAPPARPRTSVATPTVDHPPEDRAGRQGDTT